MEVFNSAAFWALLSCVGGVVSVIGAIIVALVKTLIHQEAKRLAEIHGAIDANLLDKEKRIRQLESDVAACANREDLAQLRDHLESRFNQVEKRFTQLLDNATARHDRLVELINNKMRRR
jgi:biopolymer transport protein ExbB/TolQ